MYMFQMSMCIYDIYKWKIFKLKNFIVRITKV